MKLKVLALLAVASLAASAFGQGVILDNLGNAGAVGALTGGRVYLDADGAGGAAPVAFDGITFNLGVEVFGGASSASTAMGVFKASTDPKGYTGADIGQFQLGAAGVAVNVPGVTAGNPAWIQLNMWYDGAGGLFPSYAAAQVSGLTGSVLFQQATSNPGGQPPVPATGFGSMPSVVLMPVVPEPSTLALGAMGLASLLIFRRRN